jgi:hypothetical protein
LLSAKQQQAQGAATMASNRTSSSTRKPGGELPADFDLRAYVSARMTHWFSPVLLIKTGLRTLASKIFAAYADKRAILAALGDAEPFVNQWADRDELWIDYVADLGDGWDATYTVAWHIAQARLVHDDAEAAPLPRGDILVMGGDQVYPYASIALYKERLVRPYKAALPWSEAASPPAVFALPGNHDWYDGLEGFTRRFCQHGWLGGWRTHQSHSYFAVLLPQRWWLWGVDTQLDAYIDRPQLEFFRRTAETCMQPGDRVILCCAEPSWVFAATRESSLHRNLAYLENHVVVPNGGSVYLTIAGDLHHYAQYREVGAPDASARRKITCGGGGAFTHGTHNLPATVTLEEQGVARSYLLEDDAQPAPSKSHSMLRRNFRFPFYNPSLAAVTGAFYFIYAWILQSAGGDHGASLLTQLASLPPRPANVLELVGIYAHALLYRPSGVLLLAGLVAALIAFAQPNGNGSPWPTWIKKAVAGTLHGGCHIALLSVAMWLYARYAGGDTAPEPVSWSLFNYGASMFGAGAVLGGMLLGAYLYIGNRWFGYHRTEAFSSFRGTDCKSFLRLHISPAGLTVYPVHIDTATTRWRTREAGDESGSWVQPAAVAPCRVGAAITIRPDS